MDRRLRRDRSLAGDPLAVEPHRANVLGIGEYAGELSISLRTDAAVVNVADSQRFLQEFVEALECLASEESDAADA